MNKPQITVLMPVYNGEKFLRGAIESILRQTFANFEFLIINDGSTDSSQVIIESYNDSRIRLINHKNNLRLIASLNEGIELARGEYIARMDADDVSLPTRLQEQIDFMEKNPEIGICGTWTRLMGFHDGYIKKFPINSEEIRANLLFFASLAHPTTMFRRNIFTKHSLRYNPDFIHAEDYDLWTRTTIFTKISNIPKVLLHYRMHDKSISSTNSETQNRNARKIIIRQLINLHLSPTEDELNVHKKIKAPKDLEVAAFFKKKEAWLKKLITQNNKLKYYQEPYFSNIISIQWLTSCYANIDHFSTWKIFWKSDFSKKIPLREWQQILKFLIKCLLNKK